MTGSESTRWSIILGAAGGEREARERFAGHYEPVIRAYLAARWRDTALLGEIDDAAQEVFLECFRDDGALGRVDPERGNGFRAFLFGVTRNVARRVEARRARRRERQPDSRLGLAAIAARERDLSSLFDRAWGIAILKQAVLRHEERARAKGGAGPRRAELLRLRFRDGLPLREIARLRQVDPARVHKDYALAKEEFREALLDVLARHHGAHRAAAEEECTRLLAVFT
jgi:RNA polymerase sigma-70 factor (ECF subfamily)